MYSSEYSGILYMFSYPILVSMACLLTSCNIQIMQTLPLTGPGGDQLLTPSLQLFLLLKQYILTINATVLSLVPFKRPKKSRAPQKVKILCKGPFRILELDPFNDLAG